MIDKTIGQYRIIDKLGSGGMGDVWLAEDTQLNRKVALKFLRADLQVDEKAKQRLLREARAIAALNQPFICSIYGMGEEEGSTYLAMEYVEGETLYERLLKGPIPLREALRIGIEVAEALEKAHQNGIIHRDLKPSNIMITPEGHAKVMDFGLAKTVTGAEGVEDHIHSLSMSLTDESVLVGTVSYMSPEQVRAQEVDARSDIFAFGVILYEMITGRHPFRTGSPLETAAAIITEEAPRIPDDHEEPEHRLQPFLDKLLAKGVEQRPASLSQVREGLAELLEDTSAIRGLPLALPLSRRRQVWFAGAAAVLLIALLTVLFRQIGQRRDSAFPMAQLYPAFLPVSEPLEQHPSIHPEGRGVLFDSDRNGYWDIYYAEHAGESQPLTDDQARDCQAVWSPSGDRIAFKSNREGNGIYIMSPDGDRIQLVTNIQSLFLHSFLSWRCSDRIVFVDEDSSGVRRAYVIAPDGTGRTCLTHDIPEGVWTADLSRSGRFLVCCTGRRNRDDAIILLDLESGEQAQLPVTGSRARWGHDDRSIHFVYFEGGPNDLWSVRIDPQRLRMIGEPHRRTSQRRIHSYSFGPEDSVAVLSWAEEAFNDVFVFPESEGPVQNLMQGTRKTNDPYLYEQVHMLPGGAAFFAFSSRMTGYGVVRVSLPSGSTDVFPPEFISQGTLVIDPTGRWVIVSPSPSTRESIPAVPYIMRTDGSERKYLDDSWEEQYEGVWIYDWSPDGTKLSLAYVRRDDSLNHRRLGWIEIDQEHGVVEGGIRDLQLMGINAYWAPDGAHMAYCRSHPVSGTEVVVTDLEGTNTGLLVERSSNPYAWSSETGFLYYLNRTAGNNIWRIRTDSAGAPVGSPEPWGQLGSYEHVVGLVTCFEGGVYAAIAHAASDLVFLRF